MPLNAPSTFYVTFERYGAVGDGVTNDTVACQAAIDAAATNGWLLLGVPNSTYLVYNSGSSTIRGISYPYCLKFPSDLLFDGQWCTFKQAASQKSAIIQAGDQSTVVDNLRIANFFIDGNSAGNPTDPTLDVATPDLQIVNSTNLQCRNVTVRNSRFYAGSFLLAVGGVIDNIQCLGSEGVGWELGLSPISGVDYRLFHTKIGFVYGENCLGTSWVGVLPGNAVFVTGVGLSIGTLQSYNCAGGHKIEGSCENVTIGQSVYVGGSNATDNCGTKLQGQTASPVTMPTNVAIGLVSSSNCAGRGLYDFVTLNCSVDRYDGFNNGGTEAEIWIEGSGLRIGSWTSTNFAGSGEILYLRPDAANFSVGPGSILNPTSTGVKCVVNASTHDGFVDKVQIVDGNAVVNKFLENDAVTRIMFAGFTGPATNATYVTRLDSPADTSFGVEIGPVIQSADALTGTFTPPSSGATSQTVLNGNIHQIFVGSSSYLIPLVSFTPVNGAARALGLPTYVPVAAGTPASDGFVAHYPAAVGTEIYMYELVGYRLSPAQFT